MKDVWNASLGTAGGPQFGAAVKALAQERGVSGEQIAAALQSSSQDVESLFGGTLPLGVSGLANLALVLRARPIELMQKTGILGLDTYAAGLDPLYFLPEGPTRYEARIYMREINPRHPVPEADMTRRNPTIKVLTEDAMLDPRGRVELELAYLLRTAVQGTSPTKG